MRPGSRIRAAVDPEAVAIAALGFIAGDAERLVGFLSLTGLTPESLRRAAADPAFLPQVLAYIASDEALLLAFAANEGLAPETVARACAALNPTAGEP